jgi:hypothetical protein
MFEVILPESIDSLLDHLGSLQQDGLRNGQAESLVGLQIDEQVELRGLFHRQVGRLGPFRILSTWVTGP